MCQICKKFKKGSITVNEAREELEEHSQFLNEDHIEEIEEMLFEAEDTYDYIKERKNVFLSEELDYDEDDGAIGETELPDFDEGFSINEDE